MHTFDRISFNHFYIEVKNIMDAKWFPYLNPEMQTFWKSDSCYFALTISNGEIYVNMLQGKEKDNIKGMRALVKEAKYNKIKAIRFGTNELNKRNLSLFKYTKATHTRTLPNYYETGEDYVEFVLDLTVPNSRFD